ncbi:MAG: UDP-N-acetylglucosamine 1-carboxyvinyltransferase [Gammaproteobacteria bacterium]
MEKLKIIGGNKLSGSIFCSGAKNAALPMLAATILTDKAVTFKNLPYLQDITTMFEILGSMGADITLNETMDFTISTSNLHDFEARYELVKTMRASILVLGSLVARHGFARIALPGGCAIGTRPVDFHLDALEQLGAKIELKNGYIEASANKLKGCEITFPGISVTGTENIMMAAVLAEGQTILRNVAKEPEVEDLANFLISMGAKITGAGTDEILINGVSDLHGSIYTIPADRIEAGTYLIAAAITEGDVTISNIEPVRMNNILDKLKLSGATINVGNSHIHLSMNNKSINPVDISTAPFPGFPTDMQAQFTVLNSLSDGSAVVTENVFENRFMHVQELNRMGCNITVKGSNAFIKGVSALTGAPVMATDLRASASLILAGLCAQGETIVDRIYHIDRGYERIEEKLSYLGANITRLPN